MNDRDIQSVNINALGRYTILQRLGRGGMGDVWLCEDPRLHRQVAIKTLPRHNQQDQEFVARFEHEAQAAAALNHPHILPVHDYGKQPLPDGSIITYIVMPYIRGGSLADRIASYTQKHALMPIPEAMAFLSQAAEAIDYAHEHQVVHRDIKPGNMLLRDANWLLLADFGIARMLTNADRLTATGPGLGTAEYMAPEQAQNRAETRSDNYSLAVIAYQFFTGRLPFQADTNYAITVQHLTMPPPPPRQVNPRLSPAFEQALLQGLAKQPIERPASATAFVEALQNALANASLETTYRETPDPQILNTLLHPDDNQTITEQETVPADPTNQDSAQSLLTRRRLLLGGSAAAVLAIGGGLGAWKLISTSNTHQGVAKPTAAAKTTKKPDAPMFVLTGHNQPAETLAWHPQKRLLVSASGQDYWMITWDIDALLKQPHKSLLYTNRTYLDIGNSKPLEAWSSDGKYLAVINNGANSSEKKASIDLYTLDATTRIPGKIASIVLPTQSTIYGFGWLHNRYIITVEQDDNNTQFLMRMTDSTQPDTQWEPVVFKNKSLALQSLTANVLTISSDNSMVAINCIDSILVGQATRIGNTVGWHNIIPPLQSLSDAVANLLAGATWSANGNQVISIDDSDNIPIYWNWRESKISAQRLNTQNSSIAFSALASNPASTTPSFATGNKNGEVSLWNAMAQTVPTKTLDNGGITGPVIAMAWSQDGHWLAASLGDTYASILIWKL